MGKKQHALPQETHSPPVRLPPARQEPDEGESASSEGSPGEGQHLPPVKLKEKTLIHKGQRNWIHY